MKKMICILLIILCFVPSAFAEYDFSGVSDAALDDLLTCAEFFVEMTNEEIQQFIVEIKAEQERRATVVPGTIKGSVIYEDDDIKLSVVDFFTVSDRIYGPLSVVELQWQNKKSEATSQVYSFKIEQYQNGAELKHGYLSGYDNELMTSVRAGATLTFYLVSVLRDETGDIELIFDKPYHDYYDEFDDIVIPLR